MMNDCRCHGEANSKQHTERKQTADSAGAGFAIYMSLFESEYFAAMAIHAGALPSEDYWVADRADSASQKAGGNSEQSNRSRNQGRGFAAFRAASLWLTAVCCSLFAVSLSVLISTTNLQIKTEKRTLTPS
jgi:hypothetical protein